MPRQCPPRFTRDSLPLHSTGDHRQVVFRSAGLLDLFLAGFAIGGEALLEQLEARGEAAPARVRKGSIGRSAV